MGKGRCPDAGFSSRYLFSASPTGLVFPLAVAEDVRTGIDEKGNAMGRSFERWDCKTIVCIQKGIRRIGSKEIKVFKELPHEGENLGKT